MPQGLSQLAAGRWAVGWGGVGWWVAGGGRQGWAADDGRSRANIMSRFGTLRKPLMLWLCRYLTHNEAAINTSQMVIARKHLVIDSHQLIIN